MFCETFYLKSKALIQIEEEEGQISLEIFSFYKFHGVIPQFITQFLKAVACFMVFFFLFSLFLSVPKTLALAKDRRCFSISGMTMQYLCVFLIPYPATFQGAVL